MLMNDYLLYGIVALIVIIVLAIVFTYIIKTDIQNKSKLVIFL